MNAKDCKFYSHFESRDDLKSFGSNALLLYSLQIKYGIEDILEVASSSLVDGNNDKKTDLVYIDMDRKEAVIAQGYFTTKESKAAPSNKASDLNTAIPWLLSRQLEDVPERLKSAAHELRSRIRNNEINKLTLWYSHNLPESSNVEQELHSAELTLKAVLNDAFPQTSIEVCSLEVGLKTLESWYEGLTTPILVTNEIHIKGVHGFEQKETKWKSFTTIIPAYILYDLYKSHKTELFSANVRDYLGSRKSDSNINNGIKATAEQSPENFYVYNNGITALVNDFDFDGSNLVIKGISIVNGAQTTGALGSLEDRPDDRIFISLRLIKCQDEDIIASIVKYNNSQNKINAPDFRSNDEIQKRLASEFKKLKNVSYSSRRGGSIDIIKRNPNVIPSVTAGQVLASFHRQPRIAYNEKSKIWESDTYYSRFFNEQTTAKHIFFAYTLHRAIEQIKFDLMQKVDLTDNEISLLSFLRSRGSVVLFVTAVSTCIEEIIGRKVPSLFRLHFTNDYSIDEAIHLWTPVLNILSSFSETLHTGLTDGIKNTEKIDSSLGNFKQLISAVKTANSDMFQKFSDFIEVS